MGFHWPFFAKPQPTDDTLPMRAPGGQFTSSPKTSRLERKKEETSAALRRYVTEQKLVAAVERAVR
jgi:hypothetical protein